MIVRQEDGGDENSHEANDRQQKPEETSSFAEFWVEDLQEGNIQEGAGAGGTEDML